MFLGLAYGQDYFPLQTGNQWIYQSGGAFRSDPWVVEVTGAETINGQEYFKVTGFPGIEYLRKNEAGTLIIYDREARAEKTWAAFGAATGEAWRTEANDCNSTAVITSRTAEVKLPAGDFNNALRIAYSFTRCADAGLTTETFLPSIGLAERRELSIAGERVYSLVYARVGDTVQVAGREWGFGVALNEVTFRPGESMQVRMTLRNTKARPVKLVFPSGQDYDIVIRDARNQVVYTWSATRSFIAVIREVEIRGEKNWLARVNIGPAEGNLPPGEYTLTASLATTGNRFQATVPLTIEPASQPGITNAQ
ncbi:MAG: hypothetical protein JNL98_14610 [Bryobacterales bacterium]|nr:hypothetical protein [Bryobacterales bacterium]